MKYLVISDIHGSLNGAKIIEKVLKIHSIKKILCLGDILYHGPRNSLPEDYSPKEVINILNSLKDNIIAVRGNCDAEVDQMVLDFPITADYNIFYNENRRIFISHGHVYGIDNLPTLNKDDVFIFGHIHIPMAQRKDNFYILNPGSISLPKQNHPKTYGILDENSFKIYTIEHRLYMSIYFNNMQ